MFKIVDITAGYGEVIVLKGISLKIEQERGEIVSLVGANAAGKSTLLNVISGLIKPQSGEIWFEDERIDQLSVADRVARGIVQIPEGRKLFPEMSVRDNLIMGAFGKEARKHLKENMDKVYQLFPRLLERSNQVAGSLSGGEQQMLALGRGLMSSPRLLMLDEPSLGLAPILVQQMLDTVKEISLMGTAIFLVEQNIKHALSIAEKAYVIEDGCIVLEGTGDELLHNDHVRRAYLGI